MMFLLHEKTNMHSRNIDVVTCNIVLLAAAVRTKPPNDSTHKQWAQLPSCSPVPSFLRQIWSSGSTYDVGLSPGYSKRCWAIIQLIPAISSA